MTQTGDPYENALAGRVNRTIKEDMLQNRGFVNVETAQQVVSRAITHYNTLRLHGTGTPERLQLSHRTGGPA